jgi:quercetin dioxygenase-like cupin family protein
MASQKNLSEKPALQAEEILSTSVDLNGKAYTYPAGKAQLSVMRLSLPPHTSLPWHTHPMPNIAYLLSGKLMVEDKETGHTHTFYAGQAINESVERAHRGYTTEEGAELVITYAGAEGQTLSVPLPGEPAEF